jgi:hypothetical protein
MKNLLERLLNAVDNYNSYRTQFYLEELVRLRREVGKEVEKYGPEIVLVDETEFQTVGVN